MADQVETGIMPGAGPDEAALSDGAPIVPGHYEPYHGRPVSWVAVGLMMAGFLAGGLGLVFGPTWWAFWVGLGLVVIGGLLALSINIFEDWY